ncbi:MAG: hypothetical protein A3D67_01690 [Candidatus Lloydbacteria bacterium RIFCSPHIGHO2_02_FULL_51_22]|uniref:Uncharacterized protein n=2 Tax=Candidatus Lloydiibacteriota TaxID=1817910 RepID=A0A1G2DFR9_9BACT|nr:MAG: hypothetical protein A3D67_01690 [Candidatus Lloydbacteria bacterium RIFCSPHIGHO2_02_FULL_51_22]OGZ14761.1 MAG: hypothetical protein A3J08_04265 [Candidatus Lloydbacteria bacterium RIFCSPLOWO2_02_FULL_51_11]
MKKALTFVGVILIGSVAMVAVDAIVGVSFKEDVTAFARITHDVALMLWGGILAIIIWPKSS